MARSNGAITNGGWPPQRPATGEPDPRTGRPVQPQQRPAAPAPAGYPPQQHARPAPQGGPGSLYPSMGYPDPQGAPNGYEPQQGYHYPQQGQPAQSAPPRQSPQGYGSPYAQPQSGYGGQPPQQAPQQPSYAPTPTTQPPSRTQPRTQPPAQRAPQARQPNPGFRQERNGAGDFGAPQSRDPRTASSLYDQWPPAQSPAPQRGSNAAPGFGAQRDAGGYDLGAYMPAGHESDGMPQQDFAQSDLLQQQAAWMHPAHADFSDEAMNQAFQAGELGYDPGHAGALEPTYNPDEAAEYEYEEPKRGSWVLRIAGAVVVAIGLGYGVAQGYKMVMGAPSGDGETPVVRSDGAPARTKPSDPGGREFAHTDSKIMGRLGDGSADTSSADSNGTRKVTTLQVGRDGSIVPPAAPVQTASSSDVSVPGVTVIDGFGGSYGGNVVTTAPEPPQPPTTSSTSKPIVVNPPSASSSPSPPPPSAKPDVIARAQPSASASTAKKPVKTAAVSSSSSGADGYVVVLASVPASSQSRLSALRKFADMQQQYGTVLQNKTPDVREANLGDRGTYHRLVVGPPSSRSQANELCTQLKASGYNDCWVMAY